eukprot:TRINITY_DN4014_c0_g1_i4.p1 TRINITY_DN4014_c0_g1~~TRINITY_DN4014_c0_g1_i4.p1  ORF type:complete len:701 (-),score=164.17 TRINITY_DN4014_c0_g1_i4:150-2174(-)
MESCKEATVAATSPSKAVAPGAGGDLKAKLLMLASPLRAGLRSQSPKETSKESPEEPDAKHVAAGAAVGSSRGVSMRADAPAFVPGQKGADDKPAGPPVVSVRRMPAKGCAIVLLRDRAVLELSVAMRVAVIDGVCVEVRKHTRKKEQAGETATDEPEGVFVAWGHRVARKVDISEEGLEAYFNGLSTLDRPSGLGLERPFEEQIQSFLLSSGGPMRMNASPKQDDAVAAKMLEGIHGRPELVRELWEAKEQLDDLWNKPPPPLGRSMMQRVARDQLFPHSGKEGEKHENRAGEKLEELSNAVGLLEGVPVGAAFLDLCGGPGAWSQFLLAKPELAMRGFGLTLRSGSGDAADWQAEEKDDWYADLLENPNWSALWGADGTGDLLKPKNLEHSANTLKKQGGVFLCVADGGFSDKAIPPNLLELYFYRLFLAELLTSLSILQPGGRFVCKLYTACSDAMASLLFLTTRVFDHVEIVKPMSSRVAGPERYLFASGFRAGAETESIRAALIRSHQQGNGASPLQVPLLSPLVASADLATDKVFTEQFQTMVSRLLERQAGALRALVSRALKLEDIAMDTAEKAQAGARKWAVAAAAQREAAAAARREADEEAWSATPARSTDWTDRRSRGTRDHGTLSRSGYGSRYGNNSRSGYASRNAGDSSRRQAVQPRALAFQ